MKILKKFKDAISFILKPSEIIFRVIDIFEDTSDSQTKVRYQAIGKRMTTVEPIKNIVKALIHIQGFSDKDSAMILDAHNIQAEYSPLSLESILFNEEDPILLIRDNYSNERVILSISKIEQNIEMLNYFNQGDAKALISMIFNLLFSNEAKQIKSLSSKNNINKVVHIR